MVILDIDDTLINHSLAERIAAEKFGNQYSQKIPGYHEGNFASSWRKVALTHFADFLNGEVDFREHRRRRIRDIFRAPDLSAKMADDLFAEYLYNYESSWQLYPDVLGFLESHHTMGLGVLSDGEQHQQEEKLTKMGILKYFSFVITADSCGLSKPDPDMFHLACRHANVEPKDAWYIGDNLEKDALGASNAGLLGVWLNRNGRMITNEVKCIESLSEFKRK